MLWWRQGWEDGQTIWRTTQHDYPVAMTEADIQNPMDSGRADQRLVCFLLAASGIYTGLPYLCFFVGWLRWWAASLGVILLGVALGGLVWIAGWTSPKTTRPASRQKVFFKKRSFWAMAVAWVGGTLLLVSLSGAGGIGLQEGDYFKHNAVLKHLIVSPWPVWLQTDHGAFPLVYYSAWYLPAAVVGKWAGWTAANGVLFFWTALGVLLALAWFAVLVGRCGLMVLAVFFLFSAPDVLGAALFKLLGWDPGPPRPPPVPHPWGIDWYALRWWNWELRWWAGPYTWNYCSLMELLFWVPQQAIGSWLCSGMMMVGYFRSELRWRRWALVPLALSALWSPLVTVGLSVFCLAELLANTLTDPLPIRQQVRAWLSLPNLAALALLGIIGLYCAAHFGPVPFTNDPRAEFRFLSFDDWPMPEYLFRLGCFWLVDVGTIVGLILLLRRPAWGRERILFGTAIGVLLVLSLFRYGLNNDLGMRVSMPSLFVLAVFLGKAAVEPQMPTLRRIILVGALALMATTPLAEVYRHLCEMRRRGQWLAIPPMETVQSLWELNQQTQARSGNDFFFRQYIGSPEAVFFRYLAAPAKGPVPLGQEERVQKCPRIPSHTSTKPEGLEAPGNKTEVNGRFAKTLPGQSLLGRIGGCGSARWRK